MIELLNKEQLEGLKSIEYEKAANSILSSIKRASKPEDAVYAAAYVLMKSIEDYRISIDSLDLYFKTAEEDDLIAAFIRNALAETWDTIRELKFKYDADTYKAVLLFYEFSASKGGDCATPVGVAKLAARLLEIQPGYKVLDIGTGNGTFIRESFEINPDASYTGLEISPARVAVAKLRAAVIGGGITIKQGNIFDSDEYNRQFDVAFANYPLGMKPWEFRFSSNEYFRELQESNPEFLKASSMDWIFNHFVYKCIGGPRRAICIMSNGSTWNNLDAPIRRRFLSGGAIEAVIALPDRLFDGTNIGTTMIIFSHGNNGVRLIDARELCEKGRRSNIIRDEDIDQIVRALNVDTVYSKTVSYGELSYNNYVINPSRYLEKTDVEIKGGVPLDKICKITRGAQLPAAKLDALTSTKETDTQYLMLANIQNGIVDDDLPYLEGVDEKFDRYVIKDNSLILAKISVPLKIAVAEFPKGKKVIANGNLYVLEIDEEKADPYFVKAYLESDQGLQSLRQITVGTTMPSFAVEGLKKLMIPLPSLEEQRRIAEEYKAIISEVKLLRRKTEKALDRMSRVYADHKEE